MTPPASENQEEVADRFEAEMNSEPQGIDTEEPVKGSEDIPPTPWEVVNDD
jgi:hypothetical protein